MTSGNACRYTEAEIATEIGELRQSMLAEQAAMSEGERLSQLKDKDETHALAKRKEAEMQKLAGALGVRSHVRSRGTVTRDVCADQCLVS